MAVKVIFLLASLAVGRRPQLDRVSGDAHVYQAAGGDRHQYEAAQYDQKGMPHTKGTPGTKQDPQDILKAFAQCLTTGCIT